MLTTNHCLPAILASFLAFGCSSQSGQEEKPTHPSSDAGSPVEVVTPLPEVTNPTGPKERAIASAQAFAGELKTTLLQAMQSNGPENAVDVCSKEAPQIAARIGQQHGVRIGRVAVQGKERNETNAAAGWQRVALQRMEEEVQAGGRASEQVFTQSEGLPDGVAFRMMKGIETEGVCVTCHGGSVADSVLQAIQAAYPDDRATGFEVGDLRGALWVEVPLR